MLVCWNQTRTNSWNKRKLEDDNNMKLEEKVKKRKKHHGPVQPKNATCQLNELHPGLNYEVLSQNGPTHCPVFEVSVTVNGQVFVGRGRSKKLAKQAAAEAALASFVQFVNADDVHRILSKQNVGCIDFTVDEYYNSFDENRFGDEFINDSTRCSYSDLTSSSANTDKNPVMILNELKSGLVYNVTDESGEPHSKVFTVKVETEGEVYEGQGSSKKLAKAAAAKAVLADLYNIKWMSMRRFDLGPKPFPQKLTDQIAKAVQEKFGALLENYPNFNRRGVVAGIAMTKAFDPSFMEVIAVTTGTKCISGEHLSLTGTSVNDCHGEVLARRCLLVYLYNQLESTLNDIKDPEAIFEHDPLHNCFNLKEGISFHLYISTAPCGDARVFSPHEGDDDDRHPNRKARGKLRTKIESGEGTIPVPDNFTQTWDGVLQGQRLLTMSCSDKIARWNVLGVQGALLSSFLAPIYFESIIIGSLFHSQHMRRAIGGRLNDKIQGLPPPFIFHEPLLGVTSSSENRQTAKAPNSSIIWISGMNDIEIINGITGKLEPSTNNNQMRRDPSRLSKSKIFERWLALMSRISTYVKFNTPVPKRYADAKGLSLDYHFAKSQFFDAFNRAGFGIWVGKPVEQDLFECIC